MSVGQRLLIFLAVLAVMAIILSTCGTPTVDMSPEGNKNLSGIEWMYVDPPWPDLECKIAKWSTGYNGYAIMWCRERE